MRSWQIALGFVAVFTVGFYFGLQQQSGLEQSGLEALLSPSAIQSEGDAASIIAKGIGLINNLFLIGDNFQIDFLFISINFPKNRILIRYLKFYTF